MHALEAGGVGRILHSCASDTTWDQGIGHVLLTRELPGRQVAIGYFLVDMYAMGVKNAMFEIAQRSAYEKGLYAQLTARFEMEALKPECVRNLVEGAVEFARHNGFAPHPDYLKAKAVFGDIDGSLCTQQFEYGLGGKPLVIPGPYDDPAMIQKALQSISPETAIEDVLPMLEGGNAIEVLDDIEEVNDG